MKNQDKQDRWKNGYPLNIYVRPGLVPSIDSKAQRLGLSRSAFIRMTLERICADEESLPVSA